MKKIFRTILTVAAAVMPIAASAQSGADPQGYVTYALPMTTITIEVEAVQEMFYAGPYAKYAEKYLGVTPRAKDESLVQLTQIKMTPYVEADQNCRYSVNLPKGTLNPSVFTLSSAGLVTFADAKFADETIWSFPVKSEGNFSGKGVSSNLTSEAATLYKNDKKESAYNRVSVQQNMVVQKTPEQKAAETAATILDLRRQRLQIVTGDTDATYSGEAMGAAIEELARLEQEYMTLFVGYSEYQTQKMKFEVVPDSGRENQMYIAFRISDKNGLLPSDDMTGRPVVMEIVPQTFVQTQDEEIHVYKKSKKGSKKEKEVSKKEKKVKGDVVNYRIPSICTVKIKSGADLLLQSRVPVYQLGQESSIPAEMTIIK